MIDITAFATGIVGISGGAIGSAITFLTVGKRRSEAEIKQIAADALVDGAQATEIYQRIATAAGIALATAQAQMQTAIAQAIGAEAKADLAGRECTRLQLQIEMHNKRWEIALPLLEECADGIPEKQGRINQLKDLATLTEMDNRLTREQREGGKS